jgi:hypothetical protein
MGRGPVVSSVTTARRIGAFDHALRTTPPIYPLGSAGTLFAAIDATLLLK